MIAVFSVESEFCEGFIEKFCKKRRMEKGEFFAKFFPGFLFFRRNLFPVSEHRVLMKMKTILKRILIK